ncbi:MAG: hypothetical protein ACREAA_16125 [Candidatus Polarisedimenticolia bacterium]
MSCEHVRESLLEFLGEPDHAIPGDLRAHLEGCAGCREELAEMRDTWVALGRIEEEPSTDRMRARFHAMLARESAAAIPDRPAPATTRRDTSGPPRWWAMRPAFQAGLLAATLVIGVFLGTSIGSRQGGREQIEELRAEMRSMTRAVTMSLLMHQSASERLRGVGLCETAPPDNEMVEALMRVVNEDPSANVRLAALDVLASMPARRDVRDGLIASFPRQASAPVMAAMASLMLDLDGADAADAVRAAAADDRFPDTVRQYLQKILAESGKEKKVGTGT